MKRMGQGKRICRQISRRFLFLTVFVLLMSSAAFAAGSIDLNREMKITISCQNGTIPLTGVNFNVYLVAAADETGELTATEGFQKHFVNIRGKDDDAWRTQALTLEGYVLRDQMAPFASGKTGADGTVSLETGKQGLVPGLYLVLGQSHVQDGYRYDAAPFFVLLPEQDREQNEWVYEVVVSAKMEPSKLPENPDKPETVKRKVLKVWKDNGHESKRPEEIQVSLLCDGAVYETVSLNAENDWRYTWETLDANAQWTIVEQEIEGYQPEISRDGVTFVLTNTYEEDTTNPPSDTPNPPGNMPNTPANPDKPEKLPNTGQLWWPIPLLLCAGLSFIVIGLIRRRNAQECRIRIQD